MSIDGYFGGLAGEARSLNLNCISYFAFISPNSVVCSNSDEMSNILNMNQADIESVCLDNDSHKTINKHTHTVSVKHIQDAIHKLQSVKSDCKKQLLSDHFINGTVKYFTLISLLFTCMLTHGVAPSGLLLSTCTMIPVPKK